MTQSRDSAVCRARPLPAAVACLLLAATGRGGEAVPAVPVPEARFTAREIRTAVEPGVAEVVLGYDFINDGDLDMAVEQFSQTCGCMIGEWDRKPVPKGSAGRINARFLTSGLRGVVRKSLHVKFFAYGVVELVAEVTIPETLAYSTRTLRWEGGESPAPKDVDIEVRAKAPLHVLSATASDPGFSTALRPVEEGRRYRLTVTPRETSSRRMAVIQVRTDSKDPRDALQALFAMVGGQSAPAAPAAAPRPPPQPGEPAEGGPG